MCDLRFKGLSLRGIILNMRDEKWLFLKLDEVWDNYFSDVPQNNDVIITWGRRARNRLGSIKQISNPKLKFLNNQKVLNSKVKNFSPNSKSVRAGSYSAGLRVLNSDCHPVTIITINSLFKDKDIPEYVVIGTIAHELAHYAHGFHSPLEQRFKTPHAGGVVNAELKIRGLGGIEKKSKEWLKKNWQDYLISNFPPKLRKKRIILRWI